MGTTTFVVINFILALILLALLWAIVQAFTKRRGPDGGETPEVSAGASSILGGRAAGEQLEVEWPASVRTGDTATSGRVIHLYEGGMFISCPSPPAVNELSEVSFEPPGAGAQTVTVMTIWSNAGVPEREVLYRGMRVRWVEPSPQFLALVRSYLEKG